VVYPAYGDANAKQWHRTFALNDEIEFTSGVRLELPDRVIFLEKIYLRHFKRVA
jgi:hypothetical protein